MFQTFLDLLKHHGPLGLFIHSFLDAIIFPIPAFYSQVSLSAINPSNAIWLATVGYIGCLLGTPIGYYLGKIMGKSVLYRFLKKEWIDAATTRFQKNGEAAILIGSFTPIPFKVFTILSGCLNFPLWRLIAYAALGRAIKFYVVGILFYLFGLSAHSMVKDISIYIFIGSIPLIAVFLYVRSRIRKKKAAAALALSENAPSEDAGVQQETLELEEPSLDTKSANANPAEDKEDRIVPDAKHQRTVQS
jgi:membrane protein YqaA with SNARE-associated domain